MTPLEILKQYYGYDSFRGGQEKIVHSILSGQDILGIMPTGAGKSICYQVPALLLEGITLIISPLISLMVDQVTALRQSGIPAAYINSSLSSNEYWQVIDLARNGHYKMIYVSPERLVTDNFLDFATSVNISMVTVDEAHCISQWGQDFRPSYLEVNKFVNKLGYRPIMSAFTATATEKVKDDIISLLKLNQPMMLNPKFDRSNLYFAVESASSKEKNKILENFIISRSNESGIIYCSSRKSVENVCYDLNKLGYKATRYHAGLSDMERAKNQEDYHFDRCLIMVATNAFGMGIDKPNVSYVVHYNMPKDIESYYQEAGRAGRDGRESVCLLLYSKQDYSTAKWLIENKEKEIDPNNIEQVQAEAVQRNIEYKRLDDMVTYCTTNLCLRYSILRYFGENQQGKCGKCSNCNPVNKVPLVDITVDCQKIISCVYRMEERYGAKLVIDVLRGSKSAKIKDFGLDKLTTYNITKTSATALEDIINFLIEKDCLYREQGQYPVLKLGKNYKKALKKDIKIVAPIKVTTSKVKPEIVTVSKSKNNLTQKQLEIYEKIKELCRQLAAEQGVPSFYVFTDKTLIDMAEKLPTNQSEFLKVIGVSEAKLVSYGEQFINLIKENL